MSRSHFSRLSLCAAIGALAITAFQVAPLRAAEDAIIIPAPAADVQASDGIQTAVIAGGCFWGVQGVFQHVEGVLKAVSGYAGGTKDTADYETVSSEKTGHAEAVEITFDPKRISYGRLLQIYFSVAHDPTELNRQGPDVGTSYRSTIFPRSDEQARIAKAYIAQLDAAHVYGDKIVTTIEPDKAFYPAEDYHQDFLTRHPMYPYIVMFDLPKIRDLKASFSDVFRPEPVLVFASK
jgi:peptide-methionine (S)-S-oxide reductase